MRYLAGVTTLAYEPDRCTGCARCTKVCPHAVLRMEGRRAALVDRDACMECGACARNCEAGALTVRAGAGCAAGILNGWLRGGEPTCDCDGGGACC